MHNGLYKEDNRVWELLKFICNQLSIYLLMLEM